MDFEELERKRGITIFSHQANLTWKNLQLTLLDTPGHVDFVSQTEQVLRVLDCAIMVVSARDLITSHARTLWNLLDFYHVPTFVFVNKLDLSELSKADIVQRLKQLDQGIVAFDGTETEELAELDDALLEKYLENDSIDRTDVLALIKQRKAFRAFSVLRSSLKESMLCFKDLLTLHRNSNLETNSARASSKFLTPKKRASDLAARVRREPSSKRHDFR